MSGKAAVVHDRSLETYGFGNDHPFNPLRVRMALELCDALGLFEGYDEVLSKVVGATRSCLRGVVVDSPG